MTYINKEKSVNTNPAHKPHTASTDEQSQSLSQLLEEIIGQLPPDGINLATIRDLIGKDSMMLLTIFLTLIFLVPVSIPGVSTVFGAGILFIGISRLFNRNLWLPSFIEKRTIATEKLAAALEKALTWVRRMERISHPYRLKALTSGGMIGFINNSALILAALLLMAPFGLIPFSNTFPAVAILFFAIGFLQRDGACILLGHVANVATIVYFSIIAATGGVVFYEAWQYLVGLVS